MNKLFAVLALSLAAVFSASAQSQPSQLPAKKQFSIEDMFNAAGPMAKGPQFLQWSPDGTKVSYVQQTPSGAGEALFYFDPASGKSSVLIAADALASLTPPQGGGKDDRQRDNRARYGVAAYHWAPDSRGILFDQMGQLWFFDLKSGRSTQETHASEPSTDPKFSPNGRYVSYVRDQNLLMRPVSGGKERELTRDTDADLLNGDVDWLYSEELDVRSNYFWSPDSRQILYLQTNEKAVPSYPIVDWIPRQATDDHEKYPKPGDPNPAVRLGVVDLNGRTKWLELTGDKDIYIPRFGWVKPGLAWAMVLNRRQNRQDLYFIDTGSGQHHLVLTESDSAYIELHDGLKFFEHSGRFLWPSWRDGHTHLYLYSFDLEHPLSGKAKLLNQVTRGDFEVLSVVGVNEQSETIFLTANKDDARQSRLYSAKLDGTALNLLTDRVDSSGTHTVEMSKDTNYYVDSHSALMTPPSIQLCKTGGTCWPIYQSAGWSEYANVLTPQFVNFRAEDGTVLHGVLLLPPEGAPAQANGKFPLIMNPYGGPHAQSIVDRWGVVNAFDEIMAQRGFAILKVDNRGTSGRGKRFATVTLGNLCEIELRDQLASLDQALARYPQLDGSRLGWWGWSFGGTMTSWALTHSDRFRAGVAVAPVTDWREYDSTYTERYMGLPRDNPEGYDKTSVVLAAFGLHGRLLLVHGTSDDNVHMQNSMQFINALVNAGKPFTLQIYPRKTHSISGYQARTHLYHRIQQHFEDALMKP